MSGKAGNFRGRALTVALIWLAAAGLSAGVGSSASAAGWSDQFAVSVPAQDGLGTIGGDVVADADGRFTYAWIQRTAGGGTDLLARVAHADGSIGPARTVTEEDANGTIEALDLSIGPDGVARLVWLRGFATCPCLEDRIEFATLNSDGGLGSGPDLVQIAKVEDDMSAPQIGTDASNVSAIAWTYYSAHDEDEVVTMSKVPANGSPDSPRAMSNPYREINDFSLSVSSRGMANLAWLGSPEIPDGYRVDGRQVKADGHALQVRTLSNAAVNPFELDSTIDPQGKATVSFSQDITDKRLYFRQMSPTGTLLGPQPTLLSELGARPAESASLAAAADGSVLTAYLQNTVPENNLTTRTIDATGVTGEAHNLSSNAENPSYTPNIAAFPGGGGVVSFSEYDPMGGLQFVEAATIAPDGSRVSQEQLDLIDAFDDHKQANVLAVATSANGDAAALWNRQVFDAGDEFELQSSTFDGPPALVVTPPPPRERPNTRFTKRPAKKGKKRTATFRFVSTQRGSKFQCRIDGRAWRYCKSPKTLGKLRTGWHRIRVRAVKGNLTDASPAHYDWFVKKATKKQ